LGRKPFNELINYSSSSLLTLVAKFIFLQYKEAKSDSSALDRRLHTSTRYGEMILHFPEKEAKSVRSASQKTTPNPIFGEAKPEGGDFPQ
jgi:hypothetical protein